MTDAMQVIDPCSAEQNASERVMVKEDVVEMVLGALARGEAVLAVARAYGLDPKTVPAWRRRGRYGVRRDPTGRVGLLTPFAAWLRARAPEVAFNAVVLHRELRAQGFTGSEIIVRRAVRPWRLAPSPRPKCAILARERLQFYSGVDTGRAQDAGRCVRCVGQKLLALVKCAGERTRLCALRGRREKPSP